MDSMYELLMQLPLFQGISRNRLTELIEKTRFHFLKFSQGECIARRGEQCTHLKFVLSGTIRTELVNKSGKIRISEVLNSPDVIGATNLFGRSTTYPGDIFAETPTSVMQIDKQTFLTVMQEEPIFLINALNMLSRRSQKTVESFLALSSGAMKEKLALWILSVTQPKADSVKVICKQKDLYSIFGVQRSIFINALEELKAEGVIDYMPREIKILERDKLRDILAYEEEMD